MKRKQITAILMSAILTVSACMPMNSISAMAADKAGAGATEVAAEATAAQESAAAVQEPEAEPAAEPAVEPQQPETTGTGDTGNGGAATSEAGSGNDGAADDDKDGNGSASTGDTTGAAADGTTAAVAGATSEADTSAATEDAGNDATDDASAAATDEATDATDDEASEAATDAAAASTTELEAEEDATVKKEAKGISDDDFAIAVDIAYGDTVTDTRSHMNPYAVYRFTPSKTAYYVFKVRSDAESMIDGMLFDSDFEMFDYNDYSYISEGNFDMKVMLYEGSTYYFAIGVDPHNYNDECTFSVSLGSELRVIQEQDSRVDVTHGEPVTLSVDVYSMSEQISYNWEFYNDGSYEPDVTGHEASFTFTPDTMGFANCTVSDGTDEVRVDYYISLNHLTATAREESDENHYILVPEGETIDLHADVTGDEGSEYSFVWHKMVYNPDLGEWNSDFDFVSQDSGMITSDPVTGVTEYICSVTNQYGSYASATFYLNVDNGFKAYIIPPNSTEIDENLHDIEIDFVEGEAVTLEVEATANDPEGISYNWLDRWDSEIGEYTNQLVVEDPYSGDSYKCVVTDKYGTSITCTFTLANHYLYAYTDSDEMTLDSYSTGYFYVYAESDENIEYQWYFEDEPLPGETSYCLEVSGDQAVGTYKCIVSTEHLSRELIFHVLKDNHFYAYAVDSAYINVENPGDSVTLEIEVEGDDITGVTYQWYEDENGEDDNEAVPISGATSSSYTVPSVNGLVEYSCKATDKYGNTDWVYFYISINTHLKAYVAGTTDWYTTIYATPGETVTLEVEATADDIAELTNKWTIDDDSEVLAQNVNTLEYTVDQKVSICCTVEDQFGNIDQVRFNLLIENGFDAVPEVWTTDGEKLSPSVDVREDDNAKFIDVYANVPIGKTAILKTNATANTGVETIDYSWFDEMSCEDIEDAGSELTTSAIINSDYIYRCTLTDVYGNRIYINYYLDADNQFVAYPEGFPSETSVELYKEPGSQVTLTVVADATLKDRMTFKWQSCDLDNYEREAIEDDDNSITVTVTNRMQYECIVNDGYSRTRWITFYVYPENNFIVYPEGAEVSPDGTYAADVYLNADPGEKLDLHVNVLADNMEGMNFYWEEEAKAPTIWGEYESWYKTIEGVSGDTHHITANKTMNYKCTVEDRFGYSRTVTFHVKVSGLEAHPEGAPVVDGYANNRIAITTQPSGTKTLRTIVYAPEGEPLTYKWTCGPLGDSSWWDDVDSSTNELTIDLSQPKRYLCVVTDSHDNQALAYFYVNAGGVTISSNYGQPGLMGDNKYGIDVPVRVGEDVTLEAVVSGPGAENASYTWYTSNYYPLDKYESAITVTGTRMSKYICEIVDQNGTKYTLVFHMKPDNQLQVKPAGEPDGTTEKTITVEPGSTVNLAVDVSGIDIEYVDYRWKDSRGRQVSYNPTYSFKAEETGFYSCTVTDDYGTSKTVKFYVRTSATAKTLDDAQITLSQIEFPSTGKPVKPAVKVILDGKTLVNGRDYTVSYKNNIDPGTGSVIVTGITVPGSRTLTFLIGKSSQTPVATPATVSVAVGKTATVTVTDSHGALSLAGVNSAIATATIEEDKITVKGVKVGTYKLTIKAAGNDGFSAGQTTITINVVPGKTASVTTANANKGIKITWKKVTGATGYVIKRQAGSGSWATVKTITSGSTLTYTDPNGNTNGTKYTYRVYAKAATGTSNLYVASVCYKVLRPTIKSATNSASKKMTVKWAKNAKANGYQIQYSLKSNFSGAKSVPADKNSIVTKTIGGLTKGKKYYVRLRTYKKVGSKKYYSTWSATKTVVIKK